MSADARSRAGEPFLSTKPRGTWLGLAIAKRIAVAHGGALVISSTEGAGTIVRVDSPPYTGEQQLGGLKSNERANERGREVCHRSRMSGAFSNGAAVSSSRRRRCRPRPR
jgi:hypothetical protein